jgi:hypothetical protein
VTTAARLDRIEERLDRIEGTCPSCISKFAEARKLAERAERRGLVLDAAPAERSAVISAMSEPHATEIFTSVVGREAADLLNSLDDEQRKRCEALAPAASVALARALRTPLTPFVRVHCGTHRGKTGNRPISPEEVRLLREHGFGGHIGSGDKHGPHFDGISTGAWDDKSELVHTWTAAQLAALLTVDRDLASMIAKGSITVEELPDDESRALMVGRV